MGIQESHMSFGDWSLELSEETPQEILDVLTSETSGFLGHVMVTPTAVDIREVDPQSIARYTGVYRQRDFTASRRTIQGSGLLYWLGDQESHGPINETVQELNAVSFADAIDAVLPPAITTGTIIPEIGTQSFSFLFRTARYRLERICAAWEAEYEVTPQGTLNAGTPASLYPTFNNPTCFIKRGPSGSDPLFRGFPVADASLGADAIDFATRKLLVASVDEVPVIRGEADEATSKRDLHGNLVAITDLSTESDSNGANPDTRAAALLAQLTATRNNVRLSTARYDVDGTLAVGDSIYVWDVEAGLYDMANEVQWRGETYWPAKLRVFGLRWPLTLNEDGSKPGVYFREPTMAATLWDLTPYVVWESGGSTEVTVGSLARSLIPEESEPLGPVVAPVTSPETSPPPIPDAPTVFGSERQILVQAPTTSGGAALPLNVTKLDVYASTTTGFTPGPTNYIGYISVARGDINLGIAVIKRFPWTETAQTYVRVAAVNSAGAGPASTEVAVTAGLIPSAAILDLVADKIAAGTITASISIMSPTITGGVIQTAASGQRVALEEGTPDRINLYSGDVDETHAGRLFTEGVGAGVTRQLGLLMESPRISGASRVGMFLAYSSFADSSGGASAQMRAFRYNGAITHSALRTSETDIWGWLDDPTTGRQFSVTATEARMAFGTTSQPSMFMTETAAQLRMGSGSRRCSLTTTSALLVYGDSESQPGVIISSTSGQVRLTVNERIQVSSAGFGVVWLNQLRFNVDHNAVNFWNNGAMNQWELRLKGIADGNHYLGYDAGLDGPRLQGFTIVGLRSENRDTYLQVGTASQEVGVFNGAASAFGKLSAIIQDQCDPSTKEVLEEPPPNALQDVLKTPTFMFRDKHVSRPRKQIGMSALEVPDYVGCVMGAKAEGSTRNLRGIRPSSAIAWLVNAIQQLHSETDSRLKALEGR